MHDAGTHDDRWATRLTIADPSGAELQRLLHATAATWVGRYYLDQHGKSVRLPEHGTFAPLPDHEIRVASGLNFWVLRWKRPAARGAWSAQVRLEGASLTCEILTAGLPLRPAGVVAKMLERAECLAGPLHAEGIARSLGAEEVPRFVHEVLLAEERTLPLVVVTCEPRSGAPLIDPGHLAHRLAGIAHVRVLEDTQATFALTDALGKPYSVYLGAVRIYWPGFHAKANPFDHPVLLADTIASALEARRDPADLLLKRIAPVVARRVKPLEEPAATAAAPAEEPAPRLDLLERLLAEQERLREDAEARAESERGRAQAAEAKVRELERRIDTLERALGLSDGPIDSVVDAVNRAIAVFGEDLVFLPSALASAAASPFKDAPKAFKALDVLAQVAAIRRTSELEGMSMGPLNEAFRARGLDYRSRTSMTSLGRWGEEYQAVYQGRTVEIGEHLALGNGGPEACLRIHFLWDDELGRFVVAHVGRHKTNTLS